MFLKHLFCLWSISLHRLSLFPIHCEINGSLHCVVPTKTLPQPKSSRARQHGLKPLVPWGWPSFLPSVLLVLILPIIGDRNSEGVSWIFPLTRGNWGLSRDCILGWSEVLKGCRPGILKVQENDKRCQEPRELGTVIHCWKERKWPRCYKKSCGVSSPKN